MRGTTLIVVCLLPLLGGCWENKLGMEAKKRKGGDIVAYHHVGCYGEKRHMRALPMYLGRKTIMECAYFAHHKGFKIFGLQNGGMCWTGKAPYTWYGMYGKRYNCKDGKGGAWSNDVYKISDGHKPAVCKLPKVVGPCRALLRRYFYDRRRKICRRFYYGGCQGNGNNFDRKEDCEKLCKRNPGILDCDVAIIGGGISGLYMAYELLEHSHDKVCVFEKEAEVGGRILDYRFKEAPKIDVGLGAWRILKDQTIMIKLLKKLNIDHVDWTLSKPHLHKSRGKASSSNSEDRKEGYPAFRNHTVFGNMKDNEIWKYVFNHLPESKNYVSLFTYLSNLITPEGAQYLQDGNFHRGEIQDLISPTHFLEFLKTEISYGSEYRRPIGGMSSIIKALVGKVTSSGGHVFTNTEVKTIKKKGKVYVLRTRYIKVNAAKLVIAVPPKPFRKIKGLFARKIKNTPQFKSIVPIPAFKGAAIYKKAWWENVKIAGENVRAGQSFVSHDNCLGISLAHRGYGTRRKGVLHTMYTDGHCARQWNKISQLSKTYLDLEVHRALEVKYGVKIKDPIGTVYKYWDSAWHFQKSDTPYSLVDIREWAKRPLTNEDIFLIGEAYNPRRAWCEGAINSARFALQEGWRIKTNLNMAPKFKIQNPSYMPRF